MEHFVCTCVHYLQMELFAVSLVGAEHDGRVAILERAKTPRSPLLFWTGTQQLQVSALIISAWQTTIYNPEPA